MNVIDIGIFFFILIGAIVGAKRGFFKELIICFGTILLFIISYQLKDVLADFLLLNLPLFDFPNLFKNVAVLNIFVYQTVSFIIIFALLSIVYDLILKVAKIFEKILKLTVILGAFSSILGFFVGLIESYVLVFIVLFFISQPAFSFNLVMESKLTKPILESSPVLSNVTNNTIELMYNIYELKDETDENSANTKILSMMLDKKYVSYDTVKKLRDNNKFNFEGIDSVLSDYEPGD